MPEDGAIPTAETAPLSDVQLEAMFQAARPHRPPGYWPSPTPRNISDIVDESRVAAVQIGRLIQRVRYLLIQFRLHVGFWPDEELILIENAARIGLGIGVADRARQSKQSLSRRFQGISLEEDLDDIERDGGIEWEESTGDFRESAVDSVLAETASFSNVIVHASPAEIRDYFRLGEIIEEGISRPDVAEFLWPSPHDVPPPANGLQSDASNAGLPPTVQDRSAGDSRQRRPLDPWLQACSSQMEDRKRNFGWLNAWPGELPPAEEWFDRLTAEWRAQGLAIDRLPEFSSEEVGGSGRADVALAQRRVDYIESIHRTATELLAP